MRLDKFLQVTRLVKRRTLANRLCDAGRVWRNGHPARASARVAVGDVLRLDYGTRVVEMQVIAVPEGPAVAGQAGPWVEVLSTRRSSPPGDGA